MVVLILILWVLFIWVTVHASVKHGFINGFNSRQAEVDKAYNQGFKSGVINTKLVHRADILDHYDDGWSDGYHSGYEDMRATALSEVQKTREKILKEWFNGNEFGSQGF